MLRRASTILFAAFLFSALSAGWASAALTSYLGTFESLTKSDPAALSSDGWVVYGNVFNAATHNWMYGYGTFPAPNGGSNFCAIVDDQGGTEQGTQQLSVYSDYNNADHANGNWIESNVFHEQSIGPADVGNQWTFQFDGKLGNLVTPPSTAAGFLKTLNPAAGYATTHNLTVDMTAAPATWNTYSVSLIIDASLVGQLLQFGFTNTTTYYQSSGVVYDNIVFSKTASAGVDPSHAGATLSLSNAAPNPFSGSTRLDWTLPAAGAADVTIYDVTGRRIATLWQGDASAGPHSVTWDGRASDGRLAPVGVYRGVLQTAAGRVTRNLVLAR